MNKQEEQKIRETIDSLLPLKELDKYLKELHVMYVSPHIYCVDTPESGGVYAILRGFLI
jgi:hypothetical protein